MDVDDGREMPEKSPLDERLDQIEAQRLRRLERAERARLEFSNKYGEAEGERLAAPLFELIETSTAYAKLNVEIQRDLAERISRITDAKLRKSAAEL